jgi:hypothetical protein
LSEVLNVEIKVAVPKKKETKEKIYIIMAIDAYLYKNLCSVKVLTLLCRLTQSVQGMMCRLGDGKHPSKITAALATAVQVPCADWS